MRFNKTFTALALAGSTVLLSSGAIADTANFAACAHMADQVASALSSNTGSPNYRAAKSDASNGHAACAASNYDMGVSFYQKALDLLAQK
jgi:hypothetical protein